MKRSLALLLCFTALMAAEQGVQSSVQQTSVADFLPDGRLTSLAIQGEELVKEARLRNGFSVLVFNGAAVKEIPLTRVTRKGDGWLLQGEKDFPRFTCSFAVEEKQICLRLLRLEGVPLGKDSTLVLTLGARKPLQAAGKGVESETQKDALRVYWPFIGVTNALENVGPVLIGLKP
jgi:hypothetical protein